MLYIEGFVVAVPAANKDAYLKHASDAAAMFQGFGISRFVESWGSDVPDGTLTDFKGAVKAEPEEVVVFSWFEYPDKAARNAAGDKMRSDPRMAEFGTNMPFDGKRMIFGGFAALAEDEASAPMGYVDGMIAPVPADGRQDYAHFAEQVATVFRDHGASRVIDGWADDVPDGEITDYLRAVKAEENETVVYSWVEWPSKAARDAAWGKVMADPRMNDLKMPFDGKRMIFGGFEPILDVSY